MANSQMDNVGLFLPTTYEFDVAQLQDVNVNTPEFKELLVRLYGNVNEIVSALNLKETGKYTLTEFVTGKTWYPISNPMVERPAFRIVVPFGALVNNACKQVPHGITVTPTFRIKIIDCVANRPQNLPGTPFSAVPIPYVSTTNPPEGVEIFIGGVNITICTTSIVTDWTQYTDVDVILEYTKQL